MLAERTGLNGALSAAMARRSFVASMHDRGQVFTDVAVMLADGVARVGRPHRPQTHEDRGCMMRWQHTWNRLRDGAANVSVHA